ncbi:hypothetical protein MSKU3_3088 [Komagataeibacter oboediens]|nr:hypothetical protein MSKU3_3088 [Komagataeibacter oboediens]
MISALCPGVSDKATAFPAASTMAWIFEVSPLRGRSMAYPRPLFTGTRTVLVSLDNRAVDHAAFAPATQSPVDVFPVTKTDRQITPGNAGTVTIQNRFHEQTVIGNRSADMTFTTREKIFYPFPLAVTQAIIAPDTN